MIVLPLVLLQPAPPQAIEFVDASVEKGVLFEHEDAAYAYAMGGGVAWFDADADGDDDLFLASSTGRHKLFRNDAGDLVDVTAASNLDEHAGAESNIGVACADYDQDGLVDVYLTNHGPNRLYRNRGAFTFEEVTDECGVAGDAWSTSAAWADFDRDGDLDLYVGNYIVSLNFPYHYGEANDFYENLGPGHVPRFVERAAELGIDDTGVFGPTVPGHPYPSPEGEATAGCTLAVCTLDYDEDGDADLMVGNDFGLWVLPDRMWRNDTPAGGRLTFTDVTDETGFAQGEEYNMGILGRDYDHDGDWDFYLTNLGDNLLLRDDGTHVYEDAAALAGPLEGETDDGELLLSSWGIVWEDLDNDTHEDLFVVNGYIPAASFIDNDDRAEDHVWRNLGDGTFERVDPEASGANDPGAGRGVAWTDLEGDGDVDLYVMNNGAGGVAWPEDRCRLLLNVTESAADRHWLWLRLEARFGNREALGARVELAAGGVVLERQVLGDPVFLSSPTRSLHFGLGDADRADSIVFRWPSGRTSRWLDVGADEHLSVLEPVVLVESLGEPAFADGLLTLPATLRNDGDEPVVARARLTVRHPATGSTVAALSDEVLVPAGAALDVPPAFPIPPGVHAQFQGQTFERRLVVEADGGRDARAGLFALP